MDNPTQFIDDAIHRVTLSTIVSRTATETVCDCGDAFKSASRLRDWLKGYPAAVREAFVTYDDTREDRHAVVVVYLWDESDVERRVIFTQPPE